MARLDTPAAPDDEHPAMAVAGRLSPFTGGTAPAGGSLPFPGAAMMRAAPSLSQAERGLFALHGVTRPTGAYNVMSAWRLGGRVEPGALARAWTAVTARHESLRATYHMEDGVLVRRVRDSAGELDVVDAAGSSADELLRRAAEEAHRPFDLERVPPCRGILFRAAPDDHLLLVTGHHIAVDGWSFRILLAEFGAVHAALEAGRPAVLDGPGTSGEDFAAWEAELLASAEGERLWSYWRDRLTGDLTPLELPADRARPPIRAHRGAAEVVALDEALMASVRAVGRAHGTTAYAVLLAGFQALLARYTGQDDVPVGAIAAGRTARRFRRTVANLANPIVLRADLSGNPTFTALLGQTRQTVREALAHQAYPFPLLVERLAPRRAAGRSPFGDVTFSTAYVAGEAGGTIDLGGLAASAVAIPRLAARNDLDVQLVETGRGMTVIFQYDRDLFAAETIRRLGAHYQVLLAALVADPAQRISGAPLMTRSERAAFPGEVPRTRAVTGDPGRRAEAGDPGRRAETGDPGRLETLVEAQVDRDPGAIAAAGGGERLTYGDLDRRANQLAHRLRRLGAGPDVPVAICLEPSVGLVIGLFGIAKAGAACVPLDPRLPADRLANTAEAAGAGLLVTEERLRPRWPAPGQAVLSLDGDADGLASEPETRPRAAGTGASARALIVPASAGAPGGTDVDHRTAVHAVRAMVERVQVGPSDVWAGGGGALEVWGALAAGARVALLGPEVTDDGRQLAAALRAAGATVVLGTPATWRRLMAADSEALAGLRIINTGEPLTRGLADELLRREAEVWTLYAPPGPALCAALGQVDADGAPVTVGRPIPGVRVYVLDARGEPVPAAVPGEIWIGGTGALRAGGRPHGASGPALSTDPWAAGGWRYRTGDLGRYRLDGRLQYLGRADGPVEIGGYRIDPADVEAAVAAHPSIRAAAVLGAKGRGQPALRAFLVARPDAALPTAADLRRFLALRIAVAVAASDIAVLDALPLTPAGAVDREALRAARGTPLAPGSVLALPRTADEDALAAIWADVLGVDQVGIDEDFFALGGHSLLATQLASRVREQLGADLSVRDVFEAPTVAQQGLLVAGCGRRPVASGPIARGSLRGPAPLSSGQERMWFLHQLAPTSAAYNVPGAIRIRGPLDVDALVAAFDDLVQRHEILRTVYPVVDGSPMQVVVSSRMEVPLVDLESLPEAAREARAREIVGAEAHRPFDLGRTPARCLLIRLGPRDHAMVINIHHIACDQWSLGVLGQQLIALYGARLEGRSADLPPLAIQFADFARWQREWLSGPGLDAELAYWRQQLAGPLPPLDLPTDRPRPPMPSYEGGREVRVLPAALVAAVAMLSRKERASVFMALTAAFNALLSRYTDQTDILVGVPIANRNRLASEELIGSFVNTLPLRTDLSGEPTFRELLCRVRDTLLDAYAHQDVPFERLVHEVQPDRYGGHAPLVRVLVNLPNAPMPGRRFAGLAWESFDFESRAAQFDLTLTLDPGAGGWMRLEYATDLFEADTVARMLAHFEVLLEEGVANPDRPLAEIALPTAAEQEQLLLTWNRTAVPGAPGESIHDLFEAQVDRTPDAVAVVGPGESLTYRELDERANRLARHLRALSMGPEPLVAICLPRSPAAFVAQLGTLKAGGAFVPLDPSYPAGRLALMLGDSGAPAVLTDALHAPPVVPPGTRVVLLDRDGQAICRQSAERLPAAPGGDRLAYVMYTSGSTGTPKGVMGPHRGAVNRFRWMWRAYPFRPGEVSCQKTSASFVDSIWETFGPLLQGVPTVVIPDDVVPDPRRLVAMLAEHGVTRIVLVPSLLRAILEAEPEVADRLPRLRLWVSSGEALGRDLVRLFRRLLPDALLLNLYGSSEVAADSTYHEVVDADGQAGVAIGRPIDNTQVYILDERQQPVPVGIAGELYIGGHGLARGYLNRPDLTARRFVPDPFGAEPGARMYRTGDRARFRRDGTIDYLGRLDSQVKVRGFRIELREVEAALAAHPAVAKAAAMVREDRPDDRRLVGYVVLGGPAEPAEILEAVRGRLPGYMVPSALVVLDALPLTASGKVNARALPPPDADRRSAGRPPRTAAEIAVAGMWRDLLGVERVGAHDNFFDSGGHSLLAARLMARIEKTFGVVLPLRRLFEAPTVARLAALIDEVSLLGPPAARDGAYTETEL